jgi:hypothetical protein
LKSSQLNSVIIQDMKGNIYVDQPYLAYLLKEASPSQLWNRKVITPKIIGIWQESDLPWSLVPHRIDEEREFFNGDRYLESYIDEDWDPSERKLVLEYLDENKMIVHNVIYTVSEKYKIYTNGVYMWHESLADDIRYYSVRPPMFLVEHILFQQETLVGVSG